MMRPPWFGLVRIHPGNGGEQLVRRLVMRRLLGAELALLEIGAYTIRRRLMRHRDEISVRLGSVSGQLVEVLRTLLILVAEDEFSATPSRPTLQDGVSGGLV